jgi:hypothetical protein
VKLAVDVSEGKEKAGYGINLVSATADCSRAAKCCGIKKNNNFGHCPWKWLRKSIC